jgi:UDP-N-acetylglucosamine 4,6-dehydratase
MVPVDEAHRTLEFDEYYVIRPAIVMNEEAERALLAEGKGVPDGFSYDSGTNPHFLSVEEIASLNATIA